MTRFNYNLSDPANIEFARGIDVHMPSRRHGRASAVPAGTTYIVSNFPAFAHAEVVDSGNAATVANGDAAHGSFVTSVTGAASADANTIVTATAATRRDWNPWIRFVWFTGTNTHMASVRQWIGAFSADPSAVDTLATLSAACFGWDTVVDATSVASGTAYWKCNTGNTSTQKSTTTDVKIVANTVYMGEIRMNTADAKVDFYLASMGLTTSARARPVPELKLVASHASSVPVAATPLLIGGTVTVLATAAAAKRLSIGYVEVSQD